LLDLRRQRGAWHLRLARPAVARMEYLFEVAYPGGRRETMLDPANPNRVGGAFGEHSVVTFPGYAVPSWVTTPAPGGRWESIEIAARSLDRPVRARVWTPSGLQRARQAPLLVVLDGPEYDKLALLTRYLAVSVHEGAAPALRAALLDPGPRDEWYS